MSNRFELYRKLFELKAGYPSPAELKAAETDYSSAVKRDALSMYRNKTGLVVHLTLQVGDKLLENKQIGDYGDIMDAKPEPALLLNAIMDEIRMFDKSCGKTCKPEDFENAPLKSSLKLSNFHSSVYLSCRR